VKLDSQLQQPEFSNFDLNPLPLPQIVPLISPFRPTKGINIVFWENPESSPWGSEQQIRLDIEVDATGNDLLNAVGAHLVLPRDLSKGYEVVRIFPDLEQIEVVKPSELMNANNDDVFHIQPMIPADHVCPVVLMDSDEHRIDIRRICISSGQLNLSGYIPQNSFREIAERLVSSIDDLIDVGAVIETKGVRSRESGLICTLSTCYGDYPLVGVRSLCYVYIQVHSHGLKRLKGSQSVLSKS
jgi:hypothetical protein